MCFFFSSRRRHTRLQGDWSSDVCSSDLAQRAVRFGAEPTRFHVLWPRTTPFADLMAVLDGLHPFPGLIVRSEEHTSELQSPCNLVCRLLLEKKKKKNRTPLSCSVRSRLM